MSIHKRITVPLTKSLDLSLIFSLLFISLFFNTQHTFAQCSSMIDVNFDNWNNNHVYSVSNAKSDFGDMKPWTASTYRGIKAPGASANLIADVAQTTRIINGTIRAEYKKNSVGGYNGGFLFDPYFDGVEEAYLEYKVKFDKNFIWAGGGKLPGLGGSTRGVGSETNGRGSIPSGGSYNDDGFSARLMWRRNVNHSECAISGNPYFILYSYFAKRQNGDIRPNGQTGGPYGDAYKIFSNLQDDKWYTIRQYLKLNTPGQSNGTVTMWVDGQEVWSRSNLMMRKSGKSNLKINALVINTYRGGGNTCVWKSPNDEFAYFDDFKVWTGCSNPPGGGINEISSLNAPSAVRQGQKISLAVDYDVSDDRDITVMFQLDEAPWTIVAQVTTSVPTGAGTTNIEMTIPMETSILNDAYQFQTFITPTGGGWDDRMDNSEFKDVDVLEVEGKGPYSGTPTPIPGVLEIENYDKGGADVSYFDIDYINRGDANFRTIDGVDIVDANGGKAVGYISNGEWLEYTINVEESATYKMAITYSSLNGGGEIGIDIDGSALMSGIAITTTGSWNTYTDLIESITLPAGEHILRFNVEENGFNLDKITFINDSVLSITDFTETTNFSVYPNPSKSGFFELSKEQVYTVYNTIGKVISKGKGTEIDLSKMASGLYFLRTKDSAILKLMKY